MLLVPRLPSNTPSTSPCSPRDPLVLLCPRRRQRASFRSRPAGVLAFSGQGRAAFFFSPPLFLSARPSRSSSPGTHPAVIHQTPSARHACMLIARALPPRSASWFSHIPYAACTDAVPNSPALRPRSPRKAPPHPTLWTPRSFPNRPLLHAVHVPNPPVRPERARRSPRPARLARRRRPRLRVVPPALDGDRSVPRPSSSLLAICRRGVICQPHDGTRGFPSGSPARARSHDRSSASMLPTRTLHRTSVTASVGRLEAVDPIRADYAQSY